MEFNLIGKKLIVKHSESKDAFNIIGTTLAGKYKYARCPYPVTKHDPELDEKSKQEALSIATLMAASPQLLEACQSVIEMLGAEWENTEEVSILKAAIDKTLNVSVPEKEVMNLYLIVHEHRHGTDTHFVKSGVEYPTTEQVVKACSIDYEGDCEETLTIHCINPDEIKEV